MWCHICIIDFSDFEAFKLHIIKEHGKYSEHGISDDENAEDKPVSLKSPKKECDGEDMTMVLSTLPKKRNLCFNTGGSNRSSKKLRKLDLHSNTAKKLKKPDLHSNTANNVNVGVVSNKSSKKQKECSRHDNTANRSPKKLKLSSVLKKRVPKKKEKMVSSKKVFPKHRMSAVLHREDSPEHSHSNEVDHSKKSFNGDSNHVNSQPISNNNSVFLVNPYVGQGINNYVMGNQAVQPPVYVINTVVPNSTTSETIKSFDFCSSNILKWLTKHKELCKNIPYPLSTSLFKRVKDVHKEIFDHYCTASASEETSAVLKVYEELDCMIHKHINSINTTLSTF